MHFCSNTLQTTELQTRFSGGLHSLFFKCVSVSAYVRDWCSGYLHLINEHGDDDDDDDDEVADAAEIDC